MTSRDAVLFAKPITLLRPERLVDPAAWAGHIPFAFWIVATLRPRNLVELGTHTGNSYCAFLQAGREEGLTGSFRAVDHWQGDMHAGHYDDAVYDELRAFTDEAFGERAHLMRMSFDDALEHVADDSVDLLHIDGLHTYEAVKHDFETWRAKMRDQGVVLFHDTHVVERDFGVHRLFEELSQHHPTFDFSHSNGLGVLCMSPPENPALVALMNGGKDALGVEAQIYFERLGNALADRFERERLAGETMMLHENADRYARDVAEIRRDRDRLTSSLEEMRTDRDRLSRDVEDMRSDRERLAGHLEDVGTDRDRLTHDLEEMQADRDRLAHDLEEMRTDRDRLSRDVEDMRSDRERLAGHLEDVGTDRDRLTHDLEEMQADRDRLAREVEGLQVQTAHLVAQVHQLTPVPLRERLRPRSLLRAMYKQLPSQARIAVRAPLVRSAEAYRRRLHSPANGLAMQKLVESRTRWAAQPERLALHAAEPAAWPSIDISVVTYNSAHWLDSFVASLAEQDYPPKSIRLLARDNGSSDGTMDALHALEARYAETFAGFDIAQGGNVGFGAGHDHAIGRGRADFVLITNVDLTFESDTLRRLVALAVADDGGTACWEARQKPYEHPKFYDPVTGETTWCSHACVLLRRSAYEAVGGYDPSIFMYGEDVELSYRFRRHGYRLCYVPGAVVWHHAYKEANEVKPRQYSGSTLANALLRLRYGSRSDAAAGAAMLGSLLFQPQPYPGARRDLARGMTTYLRHLPGYLRSRRASDAAFAFNNWDYGITRAGPFVEGRALPADPPLVTIVIRTYRGRERLLRQAVASAMQQTYPNVEIVVAEDGGAFARETVEALAALGPVPIRHLALPKLGRSAAGNAGMENARGVYLNFLDDDDLLMCDHVETLIAALGEDPKASAAYGLAWMVETVMAEGLDAYTEVLHSIPPVFQQHYHYEVLEDHNFIPIQACLFERRLFEERGGFDEALDALEDWNLWLRYGWNETFVYVPKMTSMFRIPADADIREQRHQILHAAYGDAKERAQVDLRRLGSRATSLKVASRS